MRTNTNMLKKLEQSYPKQFAVSSGRNKRIRILNNNHHAQNDAISAERDAVSTDRKRQLPVTIGKPWNKKYSYDKDLNNVLPT